MMKVMPIPAPTSTGLTVETWASLDEDIAGELVDGHLEEEEVASWAHEIAVSWLIHTLRTWLVPHGGFVLGSETKLAISPGRGRKPDVLAYFGTRARSGAASLPPDIVVEVITATPRDQRRDRVEKKRDYSTLGVGQYWLVDPEAHTLEVLVRRPNGHFLEVLAVAEGTHDVPGCEGLRLDLDALWAEVEHGVVFFTPAEITDSDA
jgi:Uma2 family endonuclease